MAFLDIRGAVQAARRLGLADLLSLVVLVWIALATIPERPLPIGKGIDASWQYGLNMVHQRGLVVGTDVVFTMGPLAYLLYPDPGLASGANVLGILLTGYALLLYGIFRCARLAGLQTGAIAAFALATLALYWLQPTDSWLSCCLAVLLAATIPRYAFPTLDLAIAALACGITLLMKFNDGVLLCAMFYALVTSSWIRFRRHWHAAILACIPILVFQAGMTIQGGFTAGIPYILGTMEVARGYSEAMSYEGPVWQTIAAAASGLLIVLLPALLRESPRVLPGVLIAALLAVAAFKHGMVRQDGHADVTQAKLAIAGLFVFVMAARPWTRRLYAGFAIASSLVSVAVCHYDPVGFAKRADDRATLRAVVPAVCDIVGWSATWAELGPMNSPALASLALGAEFRQAIGSGTVDAYPSNIETVRANGWSFQPRPVFQSFVAYTPKLDRMNAQHIAGPRAADFVVVQPGSIDGRQLVFDDPLSFRALLDRYRVRLVRPGALLLERRSGPPRFRAPVPLGTTVASWREEIPVPQVSPGEAVMMKVDIRLTNSGRWRLALLRGAPVQFQASRKSTGQSFSRVVRANLMSGVLVSPFPRDLSELAAYFTGLESSDPVTRIYWWTPEPDAFEPQIRIEWYRLVPQLLDIRTELTDPSVSRTVPATSPLIR